METMNTNIVVKGLRGAAIVGVYIIKGIYWFFSKIFEFLYARPLRFIMEQNTTEEKNGESKIWRLGALVPVLIVFAIPLIRLVWILLNPAIVYYGNGEYQLPLLERFWCWSNKARYDYMGLGTITHTLDWCMLTWGSILDIFLIGLIIAHHTYGYMGKHNFSPETRAYYETWLLPQKKNNNKLASGRFMSKEERESNFKKVSMDLKNYTQDGGGRTHGLIMGSMLGMSKDKVKNGRFDFSHTTDNSHELIIGGTRSGKTSRLINPQIQTLANSKEKPSMIISDVKGELFNFHAKLLKDKGYEVLTLNLKKGKTDYWNPLSRIWELWEVGNPHNKSPEELEKQRDITQDEILELTESIISVEKGDDWGSGARGILNVFILGMLEQTEFDTSITKDNFNLSNIAYTLQSTSTEGLKEWIDLLEITIRNGGGMSRAIGMGGNFIKSPPKQLMGYTGTLATRLQIFDSSKVRAMVSKTTIKINQKKPQAIFIIVPHDKKATWGVVSLFVNEIYREMNTLLERTHKDALVRPMYFVLDEFGNFPALSQLESMISIGAGQNMYFIFVVQALSQIKGKYDENVYNNLMSNVGNKVFLASGSESTREEISKQMGEIEITNHSTSTSKSADGQVGKSTSTSKGKKRLLSTEELATLKEGEVIILTSRNKPSRTTLAKFWEYEPFKTHNDLMKDIKRARSLTGKELGDLVNDDTYKFDKEQLNNNTEIDRKKVINVFTEVGI